MARPTRLNADYFYHPADLRNDRRVGAIRARLGLAGYGLLLMLLEVLTDADLNRLDTDEVELELLAGDLHVETEQIMELLTLAEKVRFFARTADNLLHCPQLDEWLAPVYEKRDRVKNAQQQRRSGITATGNGNNSQPAETTPIVSETIAVVSETTPPVEYSREQYSREDSKESSSVEHTQDASEGGQVFEKKIGALTQPVPAQRPASHTRGAGGTYRDFDQPWPPQLRPPFDSPAFRAAWADWGKYLAEIGKPHGGEISEQKDLDELSRKAGGDEARALEIINMAISRRWKALIDHKEPIHATTANFRAAGPGRANERVNQQRDLPPPGKTQRSAA
jgi:hypothetical protein